MSLPETLHPISGIICFAVKELNCLPDQVSVRCLKRLDCHEPRRCFQDKWESNRAFTRLGSFFLGVLGTENATSFAASNNVVTEIPQAPLGDALIQSLLNHDIIHESAA
jgi:hypothetical protein